MACTVSVMQWWRIETAPCLYHSSYPGRSVTGRLGVLGLGGDRRCNLSVFFNDLATWNETFTRQRWPPVELVPTLAPRRRLAVFRLQLTVLYYCCRDGDLDHLNKEFKRTAIIGPESELAPPAPKKNIPPKWEFII